MNNIEVTDLSKCRTCKYDECAGVSCSTCYKEIGCNECPCTQESEDGETCKYYIFKGD